MLPKATAVVMALKIARGRGAAPTSIFVTPDDAVLAPHR
jgi:hypothetical protein